MPTLVPSDDDLLLVVDVQNDFLPGGALAVPDGDAVVAPINALGTLFRHVVLTQDWHGPGHSSFASSHAGRRPFDTIMMPYGPQVLWPDHCVQGTAGAVLAAGLRLEHAELVIRKGYNHAVDSYSAFTEADRSTTTGLAAALKARGFKRVFACGLATDYCVGWSAIDAQAAGFESFVIEDASRAIDQGGSLAAAWSSMQTAGVRRVHVSDLLGG